MITHVLILFFLRASIILGHELCRDGTTAQPIIMNFCTDYSGYSCCSTAQEQAIEQRFNALGNLSTGCAFHLKKTLCAECEPWGTHLIGEISNPRVVPWYCPGYCEQVYSNCSGDTLDATSSPFNGVTQISATWPNSSLFCNAWANNPQLSLNGGYCYSGSPYVLAERPALSSNQGLCLTKIANQAGDLGQYISIQSPIDGSNRLFLGGRNGVINIFQINDNNAPFSFIGTFLNISDKTHIVGEGGLLDFCFDPNYSSNGRFFVSYTCDPAQHVECQWNCTTNADCRFGGTCVSGACSDHLLLSVIAEYKVSSNNPNQADPTEVKRILQLSQPGMNHKAGWMEFGPDGYLYISFGDGGGWGAAASQNINYLLGKVVRIDVNSPPEIPYYIPSDNPYVGINGLDEIYARGFRNPWRGSFDVVTGQLWVGDVGQDAVEEVNLVLKGGNYGWRKYEGFTTFQANDIPFSYIGPAAFYTHAGRTGACIIGGRVYRGSKDTCNYGRYIFADVEGSLFASFGEPSADFFFSEISWKCGSNAGTQMTCANSIINRVFTFGEDENRNLYIAAGDAIYQVVEQSRCPTLSCNETVSSSSTTAPLTTGVRVTTGLQAAVTTGRANSITTGQANTVTTGSSSNQGSTTGLQCYTGPPVPDTIDIPSGELNFRSGCSDLVFSPQNTQNSTTSSIPSSNFTRSTFAPQSDPNRNLVFRIDGVTGTWNGLNTSISIKLNSYIPYQGVGMQIRYDFDGNGSWDRTEIFDIFPPDDVNSTFEVAQFDSRNQKSIVGIFDDLQRGSIEFQVWSAFNTCCELYMGTDSGDLKSSIFIPYLNITWQLPAGSAPCGFPVGITTGNPLCATTGEVTSAPLTTSPITTAPITTSPLTTSPLTTSEVTIGEGSDLTTSLLTTASDHWSETTGSNEEIRDSSSSHVAFSIGILFISLFV